MTQPDNTVEAAENHELKVFVDEKSYTFDDADTTGLGIKKKADIPDNYSLYLRQHGSNEPIGDDEPVTLKDGEHFISRPPSNVS